jgi:hypothetical protein
MATDRFSSRRDVTSPRQPQRLLLLFNNHPLFQKHPSGPLRILASVHGMCLHGVMGQGFSILLDFLKQWTGI